MKREKVEDSSLLPLVAKKEKECREKIAASEKLASEKIEKAKVDAKQLIEKRGVSVMEREAKRLKETALAMEEEIRSKRATEQKKLAALEEELKKRLPLASKEILKLILPS